MNDRDALALLRTAVATAAGETWADLGAGSGVFTRALLALVGPGGHVIAVDADAAALSTLRRRAGDDPRVTVMVGDITVELPLPPLDGVVLANVLHFVREPAQALARITANLRPGGRLLAIEYDRRPASRWVPFPVSADRFQELAGAAGLDPPRITARRPSAYGGELYLATASRPPGAG